ncbi:MAG: Glucodextranase, domain, partial [Bacteroidota bacterium]
FVEGTAGYGITTGYLDNNNLVRFIVTDRDGQYFIQQTENGTANILTGWKNNSLVKMKNAMNVFRIEKKGSKVYFYMNGSLAETHPYTKFKGGNISLFCGPTSTIEVEYVKVAYTDGRGNNNQYVNNYTNNQNQNQNLTQNVEIDVREPELERGFKSVRLKTLRVAGFIKTTGSVTQVLINGLDAFLAADGYFSIEVPLMPGDNTVNIKATDSNFKTVTKTFSAKREY